jgi:phosphomannomutase
VKRKVDFPREALDGAYEGLTGDLAPRDSDLSDGLRMTWPEERVWLHVRPSGTEPVVRLIGEAPTSREVEALLERASQILEGMA